MSTETMQNIISYVDQYFCDKHTTSGCGDSADKNCEKYVNRKRQARRVPQA